MKEMTNREFEARGLMTKVAPGIYSFLSPEEYRELQACIKAAYPHTSITECRRRASSMACSPCTVAPFVNQVRREYARN